MPDSALGALMKAAALLVGGLAFGLFGLGMIGAPILWATIDDLRPHDTLGWILLPVVGLLSAGWGIAMTLVAVEFFQDAGAAFRRSREAD